MQENHLTSFGKSVELIDELEKKSKRYIFFLVSGIVVGFITLMYLCANNYHTTEEGKPLVLFFVAIFGISSIINYREMAKIGVIVTNLTNNELQVKESYISGVYTETPKTPNNEKHFKISYDQIERIERRNSDITLENFHNLLIYYDAGIIKLAVNSPAQAKDIIEDMIDRARNGNQTYMCPHCGVEVYFGLTQCENCKGQMDWSKLKAEV